MKKITLLALLLGGALCASAATPISKHVTKVQNVAKGEVVARIAAPGTVSTTYTVIKTRDVAPEGFSNVTLAAGDVWQDGSGYQMLLDADATAYGTIIPETGGLTTSGDASAETYAEFEYKIPENADGSLTTQNIILNGQGTVQIPAGTYDWCITNPTPGDRVWIASANGSVPGRYDNFEFESGTSYIFTVSLGGSNDQVDLEIEDPTAPAIPTELAVEPGSTDAVVSWTPGINNEFFNLRYRELVDIAETNRFIDLPYDEEIYPAQLEGVYIYDADSDGNNWGLAVNPNNENDLCFTSASYSGGALSPDNWLIFPAKLGGSLKFTAMNYSSSYPDNLGVFVATGEDLEAVIAAGAEALTQVNEDFEPVYNEWTEYSFDLSSYEGMGYIIIRHYNCTDQWRLYVDDIDITVPDPKEVTDWTEVEDVDNPFTIDELTPETTYEVQVQAGNAAKAKLTAWTESVVFTTLADGAVTNPVYYVVGFNDWQNPLEIGEEGVTVDVQAQNFEDDQDTAQEFKLQTTDSDGELIWLGGADDNGVGYFAITEELLGGEISLETPGANFRLPEAGTYTIKLVMVPLKAQVEGLKMIVTKDSVTAIETINSDVKGDNNYYNLMGQKMNGNNLPAGIYIHNGKKVVVK